MDDWVKTLASLAPTVATALGGPLAGEAVAALSGLLGVTSKDEVRKAIESGSMTSEQISAMRKLEMQFQDNERERGFRYEELAFKDRSDARKSNVDSGMQNKVFGLSLVLLVVCLGAELLVLIHGVPQNTNDLIAGRVLGLLDSIAIGVFTYWFGSSRGSAEKNALMAQK